MKFYRYQIPIFAVAVLSFILTGCSATKFTGPGCNFIQNTNNERVSWGSAVPVNLHIHESISESENGDQKVRAIRNAVATWNGVLGKELLKVISVGTSCSGDNILNCSGNIIGFLPNWNRQTGFHSLQQAITRVKHKGQQIIDAPIYINEDNFRYSTSDSVRGGAVDFESLLLHELGHVLGLSHSEERGTVMHESLALGTNRRDFRGEVNNRNCSPSSDAEACEEKISEKQQVMEFLSCEYH